MQVSSKLFFLLLYSPKNSATTSKKYNDSMASITAFPILLVGPPGYVKRLINVDHQHAVFT